MSDGPAGPRAGTLLGGRVVYHQPADAYRTGIEPVLLAACVPARPGERVAEAGCGSGAGLLCLAARVPGLTGMGLDTDPAMVGVAAANLTANGHCPALAIELQDVTAWCPGEPFDHCFANPPWHAERGTPSPLPGRRQAKLAPHGLLEAWVASLAAALRRRGTLSLVLPAASLSAGVAALARADCREVDLLPLWPHAGESAKLVILRGVRGGGGPCRLLPGLTLHGSGGTFTAAAESVLRHGTALI